MEKNCSVNEKHMPLVSVVMPVFNGEKHLAEAIESILAQTFADFELVIVDDGSQDKSAEIIRSYVERDERIHLVQIAENGGEAAARNRGLAAAKGFYVAGMDCDDISLPERLWKQVKFMEDHPDIGAVGVHSRVVSEDLKPIYIREPVQGHANILLDCFIGVPFQHAALMMKRHLVLEVGGYDQTLVYSTDRDLMTGLMGRTRFANIPEILYVYRRHEGQLTSHSNVRRDQDGLLTRVRRLEKIWGEAPMDAVGRLAKIRPWFTVSWYERRAAKRDIIRLIDSMIEAEWIDASERPLLIAQMNQRLESTMPRSWQMFLHWRRHHFGARNSGKGWWHE